MGKKSKNVIMIISAILGFFVIFAIAVGITMSLSSNNNNNIEVSTSSISKNNEDIAENEVSSDAVEKSEEDLMQEIEERKKSNKVITQELLKNFRKKYDDMEQITWYYPPGEESFLVKNGTEVFQFLPYVGVDDFGNEWCRLLIGFSKEGWVFFDKITIKADDNVSNINIGPQERKGEVHDSGISEWVDLEIDRDNYLRTYGIADSKEAKIRFSGDTSYTEYTINEQQKKQLKEVLEIFMSIQGANMD